MWKLSKLLFVCAIIASFYFGFARGSEGLIALGMALVILGYPIFKIIGWILGKNKK